LRYWLFAGLFTKPEYFLKIAVFSTRPNRSSENSVFGYFDILRKVVVNQYNFNTLQLIYIQSLNSVCIVFLKIDVNSQKRNRSSKNYFFLDSMNSMCYQNRRGKNLATGVKESVDLQKMRVGGLR